ncbi:MAG TPA: beta-carotene hydroxylase [Flavobacterium sp.]
MDFLLFILIFICTFIVMEGMTWIIHKFVMHRFLWFLHRDHHQKGSGFFEKNDWFFVIFAIPCIALIYVGTFRDILWLQAIGYGIMAYGAAYFVVHDVIIHQRFKWFVKSGNTYIRAIRWAHKMHHKHLHKNDGESFGMLYVHRKYFKKISKDNALMKSRKK